MAWTAEDRREYAPAIREMVRAGMIVRRLVTRPVIGLVPPGAGANGMTRGPPPVPDPTSPTVSAF